MQAQARSWLRRLSLMQVFLVGLVALASGRAEQPRPLGTGVPKANHAESSSVRRSMPVPHAMDVERTVLHDARSIHDIASVSFDEYEVLGKPQWRLATVSPDAKSGSATIPGGYIDADGAKLVAPAGAQTSVVKAGTWKAVASAPPSASPEGGTFSWYEPMVDKRALAAEDCYSPFVDGGLILFTPVPAKADIGQFGSVRLLFSAWASDVPAAFAFYQARSPTSARSQACATKGFAFCSPYRSAAGCVSTIACLT